MLFFLMFLYGIAHGLGPDHLLAVANLSATGKGRRAFQIGLRFGAGHSVVLVLGAALAAYVHWIETASTERVGERIAGALLVVLGVLSLLELLRTRVYMHSHRHRHHGHAHEHHHIHFTGLHRLEHTHPHLSTLVGGLFALGGIRSLLALIPLTRAQAWLDVALMIALFAAGIVVAMTGFGIAGGRLWQTAAPGLRKWIVALVGACSICLGVAWIFLS